ncbi:YafY family transcriptional regulator [Vagococcus sp. BWB3-3]|uniref:YafY family transcriptional regulator n=1 Tax=Vagococcus allomyrinae TaxID=2794353 RepID=A0A940SRL4_9ENTE|nr:YafY family protein [Vagococcus allomyrinae]MBP1040962.1 YafY family transcriptional regulator [Vagococcus allomyrinae]
MSKSERINQEMLFLSGKQQFNLADLMKEFGISKSTALRDIQELERLGVPLYTEEGRYGGYRLVHQSLLTPIYFNEEEVSGIFFALQCLKFLSNSPFNANYQQISKKLLQTFTQERREAIIMNTDIVHYKGVVQVVVVDNLALIFKAILASQTLKVIYRRYQAAHKEILPIRLTIMDGFWYCIGWDLEKEAWRTYRCDHLEIIGSESSKEIVFSKAQIEASYDKQGETYRNLNFKVKLSSKGKDHYIRRHFENMTLSEQGNECYLIGTFNEQEADFLVDYLLGFGEEAVIIEPNFLKKMYVAKLQHMIETYNG